MSNLCTSYLIFKGSEEEINDFYNKFAESFSSQKEVNKPTFIQEEKKIILESLDFEDFLNFLGYKNIKNFADKIYKNKTVTVDYLTILKFHNQPDALYIQQESSWVPQLEFWFEILKNLNYKTIKFAAKSAESGFEIFEIFNPYSIEYDLETIQYYISSHVINPRKNEPNFWGKIENFYSEKDTENFIRTVWNDYNSSFEDLLNQTLNFKYEDEENYINIHSTIETSLCDLDLNNELKKYAENSLY